MTGALTRWVDFDTFTTSRPESACSSFFLFKKSIIREGYGNCLNRPCFQDASSPQGTSPNTSLEQASNRGGAWEHVTVNTLPWQATYWASQCKQVPSYPTQRMCLDACFLDTYQHRNPCQCQHIPSCFLSCPGKRVLSNSHKAISYSPQFSPFSHFATPAVQQPDSGYSCELFSVYSPQLPVSLLFLAHFKLLGTTIFLFSARTVPSAARH